MSFREVSIDDIIVPCHVMKVINNLKDRGHKGYIVGGAIRDIIMGREPIDWDISTSAFPEEIMDIFSNTQPTGKKHGTITIIYPKGSLEVTTFRTEDGYEDGRHPDEVRFVDTIDEDLSRRDFTINSIAYDPILKRVYDPFSGIDDIEKKVVRTVGDPYQRFKEDRLRMLRAVRFGCVLRFSISRDTFKAIKRNARYIDDVSWERIRDEIFNILTSDLPSQGIELMRETGLLASILPELLEGYNVSQNKHHAYSVYVHTLKVLEAVPSELHLRLAALLHDIGKPRTQKNGHFYGHEKVSAEMAEKIMKRLRVPKNLIRKVVHLVRYHMVNYSEEWTDAAVRRFIKRIGPEYLPDLFLLMSADALGKRENEGLIPPTVPLEARVEKVYSGREPLAIKDLAISGDDIVTILNIKPGPVVGEILRYVLEKVVDEPEINTYEQLSDLIKEKFIKH